MNREEAEAQAGQLNREGPDRAEHHWIARDVGPNGWQVVRVSLPGVRLTADSPKESTEARGRPEDAADPRPLVIRLIPPYGA